MSEVRQKVFNALSDPTRRGIISTLTINGEHTATQLTQNMQITRQGVTKHLGILLDAGLISTDKRGREVYYNLTPEPLTQATQWITEIEIQWDKRLAALQELIDEETE